MSTRDVAKDLFLDALDVPTSERAGFLDRQCGADPHLHEQVMELLRAHDGATRFMASPTFEEARTMGSTIAPSEESIPDVLDRFEIKKEIGRGGFGQVYLAVRRGDVKQYVAIKLLNKGADTAEIIRRFRQERKFLAALRHENIAHFIDAGESTDGRPYYVMEFVDGLPIDRHCDTRQLTTPQRLTLFLKVCSAVQLAHSKFVLHRDLKPGNILVTEDGTPKLVDFGIAKATNPEVWGTIPDCR